MENEYRTAESTELFFGIPVEDVEHMITCLDGKKKIYHAAQTVWRAGEKITQVGIILSGKVYLESCDFWGNKSIITEYVSGNSFGEAYALAKNDCQVFDAVAKEDSEILFLDIARLTSPCQKACSGHKLLIENLLSTVATKARELSDKMNHICKRTTREKLISYLSGEARKQRSPIIHIPFNRQELADYLSVERCAMSKELHKMKRDGLIDFNGSEFVLKMN